MSAVGPQPPAGKLLQEFPPVTYDAWRKLVEAELKGAPFDKKMFTATYEGIRLQPIYRPEDTANLPQVNSYPGFAPFIRGARASGYLKQPWDVSQEIAFSSPTEFNHAARKLFRVQIVNRKMPPQRDGRTVDGLLFDRGVNPFAFMHMWDCCYGTEAPRVLFPLFRSDWARGRGFFGRSFCFPRASGDGRRVGIDL